MAPRGYLALVLHAHLPFVRHPEHEEFMEEDWLYEAITETYLPLLDVMEGWQRDGLAWKLTMSMTPTLCTMLGDELLRERYSAHIARLVDLAAREIDRTQTLPDINRNARMYFERFKKCQDAWENRHARDITTAFNRFQEAGNLEIITCSATHAFLPLMQSHPEAVRAQVALGVQHYRKTFGRNPRGTWNAECGFFPGMEGVLRDNGLGYFFVDTHGTLFADRRPVNGVFAPLRLPNGMHAFGRDQESSKSVWSAELGYPGDPRYREFYRDIGFDLDIDYLHRFVGPNETRIATGIKYHRITGPETPLQDKEVYDEAAALDAAGSHSGHFLFARQQQVLQLEGLMKDRKPLIVAPFDAELFGHWWYEGPAFLDYLFRKIHFDQNDIALVTPSEYLAKYPENQEATPSMSSWGFGGYSEVWLEGSNDWIYRHLDEAATRMIALANDYPKADGIALRALNQAARELLLAQSSDWAFIMKTNTVVDYAIKRTKTHLAWFHKLHDMIRENRIDEAIVARLEWRDNIFPELDYRLYRSKSTVAI